MSQGDNHIDIVTGIKSNLLGRGIDLSGPDGAFQITKRVAWELRNERAGLLEKTSGNNSAGYATDIICYPNGQHFDILGDGGGANNPQWLDAGMIDANRYRPAINTGDFDLDIPNDSPFDDTFETRLLELLTNIDNNLTDLNNKIG